jgi:prophage maintenance system killer protein
MLRMSKARSVAALDQVQFVAPSDDVRIDVRIDSETVWLTQAQIAELFGRKQQAISHHVRKVFLEGELERGSNTKKIGIASSDRPVTLYSLDVIISVGYRVKSHRGTQFRIWATRTLKERLIQGYRDRRRLEGKGLDDVRNALGLARNVLDAPELGNKEARAVLSVIERYARSWSLLLRYDERRLPEQPAQPTRKMVRLTLAQARKAIGGLQRDLRAKGEASDLFGHERGDALAGILGTIEQSFGGELLYPSVEVRAANLLYFLIKDHPFTDGNKRIGSLLFLHYLDKNSRLLRPDGSLRFDDNALVALALLIAESKPAERELMVRLVVGLLEDISAAA